MTISFICECKQDIMSVVSVLFIINDSLSDAAPISPMLLPVDVIRRVRLLINVFLCVFLLLSSPLRLSSMSVVFDCNASLSDVAPVFPILFPVDVK